MQRKQNLQSIAWFWDLHQRRRLDLDPPYQRRSVWNQSYKDYFIDTILMGFPSPAIFLYEEITPEGRTLYHVVDGKQRLTTLFEFVSNEFPVTSQAERSELRDKYFRDLDDDVKREFWGYQFSVEYIPTAEESIINNVFDRINRNTAKLSPQELRHARFSGEFISTAEDLSDWVVDQLGTSFPNIAPGSRRQMKDIELVAHLLLLLEVGARGYSTLELDEAFSQRDAEWAGKIEVRDRFQRVIQVIQGLLEGEEGQAFSRTRFRNQADFYSLFGAIDQLLATGHAADTAQWRERLRSFAGRVDDEGQRAEDPGLRAYYEATRSASNDSGPRNRRIGIVKQVTLDQPIQVEDDDDPVGN